MTWREPREIFMKLSHLLEPPKTLCTFGTIIDTLNSVGFLRENHKDVTMDNQQERLDLAWLAGIIEGEGWISLAIVSSLKRNGAKLPAFLPNIGICNTDFLIMDKVETILKRLGFKYRYQKRPACVASDGRPRKAKVEISVYAKQYVIKLANLILPFMVGEKKNRVNKLFEFYKIRESKPRAGINSAYGKEEYALYDSLYSYKGKSRSRILNDLTLNSLSKDEDKV